MANQWFHLRLSKIEELLGLDVIEDSQVLQTIYQRYFEQIIVGYDPIFKKEMRQRYSMIQLVKMGLHEKKKKKS